jgi:hypothetical protein
MLVGTMQSFFRIVVALGILLSGLVGCASQNAPAQGSLEVVTVVVTSTAGPTQTPVIITEVQTVVVVATAEPSATASATTSATATATVTVTGTATPQPTEPSAPTATATRTVVASATSRPAATQTPLPVQAFSYAAPKLLAPVDQEGFGSNGPVLRWEAVPLGPDEYYEVTIERFWQDQPYYAGSDWVKEPQMTLPTFVRGTSDTHQYTWWVTVKRLTGTNAAGGKVGEAISPPSEQRTFTWQPG